MLDYFSIPQLRICMYNIHTFRYITQTYFSSLTQHKPNSKVYVVTAVPVTLYPVLAHETAKISEEECFLLIRFNFEYTFKVTLQRE